MRKRVVIAPHAAGIGDMAVHAALLELYDNEGVEARVSSIVTQPPMLRNPEINELIWETNPFFHGYSDEEPNAGLRVHGVADYGELCRELGDPVAAMAALHGLPIKPFLGPKVLHYEPKIRADLANVVLADPTSSSQAVPAGVFHGFAEYVCRDLRCSVDDVVLLQSQHPGIHGRDTLAGNQVYFAEDIFEWVDAIASCRAFLCTEAGGQTIGAAVRRDRRTFSIHSCKAYSEKLFIWPNVTYSPSGRLGTDFHSGAYPL